ncbi:hypothetical protein [Micromonospora sp. KC213]|uniref:hypothetical protein n=1 Tax=Micromonospora sp. KC213 TaxID=2530378 RepID=UPI0010D89A38|nr:hypothetical protein [Micromonospora sp. KC213]TDC40999.1 hypothetical protein E1166_13480 [Micromonospora sp. KC213]
MTTIPREPDMFGNDAEFLLHLHRSQAAELRADAAASRLARALPPRRERWRDRWQRLGRTDAARR